MLIKNSIQNGFSRKKVEFKKIQQIYLYKFKEKQLNLLECFFLSYNIYRYLSVEVSDQASTAKEGETENSMYLYVMKRFSHALIKVNELSFSFYACH